MKERPDPPRETKFSGAYGDQGIIHFPCSAFFVVSRAQGRYEMVSDGAGGLSLVM